MSDQEKFTNRFRQQKGEAAEREEIIGETAAILREGIDHTTSEFNKILNEMGPPPKLPDNVVLFRRRKKPKRPQK